MPFLKQQVDIINAHLRATALATYRFQNGRYVSVARLATRENQTMPIEITSRNEAGWVGVDDTYPIVIYHRKLNSRYTSVQAKQYGNKRNTIEEISDMVMIVFAKSEQIRLNADQLEAQIVTGFPDLIANSSIAQYGLSSMLVSLNQSSTDAETIFAQEYKNTENKLAPTDIMLSVRYTITTNYNKNCFDFCCDLDRIRVLGTEGGDFIMTEDGNYIQV